MGQTSVQPSTLREPSPALGTQDSTPGRLTGLSSKAHRAFLETAATLSVDAQMLSLPGLMVIAKSYPFLGIFWSMLIFFAV